MSVSGIAVNPVSLEISGFGLGSDATEWRVIRVSDGEVMDIGSGINATFSFIGQYDVQYQLQYR